jgi:hypothetical protein
MKDSLIVATTWIPVKEHQSIYYRDAVLAFKCMANGIVPEYLSSQFIPEDQ